MQTSARPRTLVIVLEGATAEVAMLGPTGIELGDRMQVATDDGPLTAQSLWPAIEAFGEFDRITVAGDDPHAAATSIAAASQRPLRHLTLGDLRWGPALTRRGVELVLCLAPDLTSALYHDGVRVPGLELGAHCFRKGKTYREYLAPRVLSRKGARTYARRLARAVHHIQAVWNPDALYLALPPSAELPDSLPGIVVMLPTSIELAPALAVWVTPIQRLDYQPLSEPELGRTVDAD